MKKSSLIVIGLVVVLGLIYWMRREDQVSVGVKKLSLPTFAIEQVDRIDIHGKEKIKLLKVGEDWMLDVSKDDKQKLVKGSCNQHA
jgi:hypothetical protein